MAKNQLEMAENQLDLADSQLQDARQDLDQLQASISSIKSIRDSLPPEDETLSDEAFSDLVDNIEPYSPELAEYISQSLSPDDPGLIRQLNIFIDAALISLEDTYAQGEAEYQAGLLEVASGRGELERQRNAYEQGLREYEAGLNEIEAARLEIEAGRAELDEAKETLDEARRELDAGEEALAAGKLKFYQEIDQAKQDLEQARIELDEGSIQFEKEKEQAYQLIDEAEAEIRESERQILELPDEWFVLTRAQQPGYSDYGDDARRIGAVATIFPLFFFLVAALVCLTTMTRMIEEERVQIGTLKALGYNTLSISSKYIVYALGASLLGSAVGIAAGFQIFPISIMNAYSLLYSVQSRLTPFHFDLAILSAFLAVATTVSVTLLAALSVLKSTPAILMQPRAPKPGKRIMLEYIRPLWNRLTFMQKLTARNLFRYKLRLMMTVIGIAGCTALLLTGFGLKDSVNAIIGMQFDEIFIYDGQLVIDADQDGADEAFETLLSEEDGIKAFMPMYSETVTAQRYGASTSFDATLLVPETAEQISDYYAIRDRDSSQRLPLTPNGAVVTEKLANLLGVRAGDSLTIRDVENRTYTLFISALAENYVTHFIYMSPQYFEQLTYREPVYSSAVFNLINPETFDQSSFQNDLIEHDVVLGSMFTMTLANDFSRSIQSLDYVVIILIIAAGALAFVVLYNLTSINISERIREIATIKVLGFRDREVSDYVFRENLLLTMFGIIAGLVLGIFMHEFVMSTMETDAIMFGKDIHWLSFVLSVILTSMFSVIVNIAMFYRLRKIGLVESLKAAE